MAALAVPALIIGTATSAVSSIAAGSQRAAAAQFESQQYAQQAEAAKTAAIQDEAARRRDLNSSMESIQAIRAGRGVGSGSPTAMALYDSINTRSEDDIQASKANYAAKADLAGRASILSERKASSSMLAGYLGAATDIANAGFKYGKATA